MAAKSKVKPSADLGFSKSPHFGSLTVIFSLCPHMMEEVREFCGVSLRRAQISSMRVLLSQLSVQFSSVAQSCPTLCDPVNCSMPGLPVHRNSWSLLKLMPIDVVMLSSHLILCHPLLILPITSQRLPS